MIHFIKSKKIKAREKSDRRGSNNRSDFSTTFLLPKALGQLSPGQVAVSEPLLTSSSEAANSSNFFVGKNFKRKKEYRSTPIGEISAPRGSVNFTERKDGVRRYVPKDRRFIVNRGHGYLAAGASAVKKKLSSKSLSPAVGTMVPPASSTFSSGHKLKITVLGGLEEVGRNMTMVEYQDDIILIDMGMQFPEEDMHGIDYIIPNIECLKGREKNIRGVIITHGHFDHIGAVSHLIPRLGNPIIYTGALSAGIIRKRHEEYKKVDPLEIAIINENTKLRLGRLKVEFFRVNHSIPNGFGVVIKSPVGTVVHTGDFKFDKTPLYDLPMDLNRLRQVGREGVTVLMADSTSAEYEGRQLSEKDVYKEMEKSIFTIPKGRIIIATFASNLGRVQLLLSLAEKFGKKVYVMGRSLVSNIEIAKEIGFLKVKKGTIVSGEEINSLPDSKVVILCTGAQGERNAALMRMANNEDKSLKLKKGDTVVFSSSVIPGNERTIQTLKDGLYRCGAEVIHYKMLDVHAGGHAKKEDLKDLIRYLNPRYYVPIEANHYMLRIHGNLARDMKIPEKNIFIADNGQVMEFDRDGGRLTNKKVNADYVFVDGLGVGDVSEIVLRDRKIMAEDGMLVIIATIYRKTGELAQNPDLISRGFIYMKENKGLVEQTRTKVKTILKDHDHRTPAFDEMIKNKIRNEIGKFLFTKTQRRPMILPVLIIV